MYLYAVKKMSIRPYKEEEVTERLRNPETQRAAFGEVVEVSSAPNGGCPDRAVAGQIGRAHV